MPDPSTGRQRQTRKSGCPVIAANDAICGGSGRTLDVIAPPGRHGLGAWLIPRTSQTMPHAHRDATMPEGAASACSGHRRRPRQQAVATGRRRPDQSFDDQHEAEADEQIAHFFVGRPAPPAGCLK